jgi:hypothetical protein
MADDENVDHKFDKLFLECHVATGKTEDGACLTRHISGVSQSSCSHRWQARERAKAEDKSWYNAPLAPGVPQDGTWNVDDEDKNFHDSTVPYWHQAHHLIPNRVLANGINTAADIAGTMQIYQAIRQGLLEAKYNLNHKTNMIILPMEEEISKRLSLPRHLETGARNHTSYSLIVAQRVQPVINQFADVLSKSVGKPNEHPSSPDKLAKAQLERVSRIMRIMVRAWGRARPGATLEANAKA